MITALRDKQREIRTAFQAKWDEFKKVDRAWKGWFAEERKKRWAWGTGAVSCVCCGGVQKGALAGITVTSLAFAPGRPGLHICYQAPAQHGCRLLLCLSQ